MSSECDVSTNLQCINDSHTNITGSGWWYVLKIFFIKRERPKKEIYLVIVRIINGGMELIAEIKVCQLGE